MLSATVAGLRLDLGTANYHWSALPPLLYPLGRFNPLAGPCAGIPAQFRFLGRTLDDQNAQANIAL